MRKQYVLVLLGLFVLLVATWQDANSRLLAMTTGRLSERANIAPVDAPAAQSAPSGFLTGPNAGDPLEIALAYLRKNAGHLGLSDADLADVVVKNRYVTRHNGVTHLYLRQRHQGIELFNGDINLNIGRNGEVISLGNRFVPNLAQAVNATQAQLSAPAAVEYAARQLKLKLTSPLQVIEYRDGPAQAVRLSQGGISSQPIPAQLVYVRHANGGVRLVWEATIHQLDGQHIWKVDVDAQSGDLLRKQDLILHDRWGERQSTQQQETPSGSATAEQSGDAQAANQPPSPLTPPTYRVFALPLEHPNDGPGAPRSQTLVNNPADTVASPFGWHDINATPGHDFLDTRGNNVFAQEDRNDDDFEGFRPTGRRPRRFNFDYTFDPAKSPTEGDNVSAAVINLFYWNNIVHDVTYHYGFDEVSGNFQENTYDRGGAGFDAVQADAQDAFDWGVTNNAQFWVTPDGVRPRMEMFVWTLTSPFRDSDLDNGIIVHEYGHGISTRLVGGPNNPYCLFNGESGGEGWSDWFTLVFTAKAGDTGAKARGIGNYVLGLPNDGLGIRRVPYSTDMSIDPQTYDWLKRSGETHDVGEVWATMLWEMYWGLVDQHGFDPDLYHGSGGNNVAMRLVMDGMKFAPCDPGFVDARAAILVADQVNNGGANQCTIWKAFAKRGLGLSAQQGSPYNAFDGVEAFDLPTSCRDDLSLTKIGSPDPAEAGKVLTYELVASNYTDQPLTGVVLNDPIPANTAYVVGSASDGGSEAGGVVTWQLPALNPDESVVRTFQVTVNRNYPDPLQLFADDMENGDANWTASGLWHLQDDAEPCGNSSSPTHSWYYGVTPDCFYTDSSSGELTTVNPIPLPPGKVTLNFMSWEEYEVCCDRLEVQVSTDGVNFTGVWSATSSPGQWHEVSADLSTYAGQSIWLRFAFRSDGSVIYRGWYVDDVQVTVAQDLVNTATLTSNEGISASATSTNRVIKTPEIEVAPTAFEETLKVGTKVVRTLTIQNVGAAPLNFALVEAEQKAEAQALTPPAANAVPSATAEQPAKPAGATYAGDRQFAHAMQTVEPKLAGLTGSTNPNVLLLAAADVFQLQSILDGYPDIGQVDIYDARLGTPTLEQLSNYDTVIVIANNSFANPVDVGNLLADYVDEGGTVVQTVPTFYDPGGSGWGLQGRWVSEGYSPFIGIGDWFSFATLGDFDASHPIMQGVDEAGDFFRQIMELAPGAELVASWTDDEFVATKGAVVALNTFLSDGFAWSGDVDLIVHNSIIWLQTQGGGDAAWLSVSPVTGTVPVDGVQTIQVTIDAGAPDVINGDYQAILRVRSNDLDERTIDIPIALHAEGPELSIGSGQSYFGRPVKLPISFHSNGINIASALFSVDFDEQCLRFDPKDHNNDGIPDAIKFQTPPAFNLIQASANLNDTDGELDLFVADTSPPLAALPDGVLATVELIAQCLPTEETQSVAVNFSLDPKASLSNSSGGNVNPAVANGSVAIQTGVPGDCNQDGVVNAADTISCVLEIFDRDGAFWLDAPKGSFAGSPQGCDSNQDTKINAGDVVCTVLTIFEGQGACQGGVAAASVAAPAQLSIPDGLAAQPGAEIMVPIQLQSNGNVVVAALFTLEYDRSLLSFDASDANGDGLPDALLFQVAGDYATNVTLDEQGRLQIAITDLALPLAALPDGLLATVRFQAKAEVSGLATVAFASDAEASLGTDSGASAEVAVDNGSVQVGEAPRSETKRIYLPAVLSQ